MTQLPTYKSEDAIATVPKSSSKQSDDFKVTSSDGQHFSHRRRSQTSDRLTIESWQTPAAAAAIAGYR